MSERSLLSNLEPLLSKVFLVGSLMIVLVSPTQWALKPSQWIPFVPKEIYLSPTDLLIPCVAGIFVLLLICRRRFTEIPRPSGFLLAFLGLAGLTLLRAVDKKLALSELFQFGLYLLVLPMLIAESLKSERWRKAFTIVFLLEALLIAVWGALQHGILRLDPLLVKATFGNRNVLSGFLAVLLPFFVAGGLSRKGHKLFLAGAALFLVPLLTVGSLLAALLGSLWTAWKLRGRFGLVAVSLVFLIYGVLALSHVLPQRHLSSLAQSASLSRQNQEPQQRYVEWQAALNSLQDTPYFGVGIGNYQKNIGIYYWLREKRKMKEEDIYNLFLVILSSTGLLGFTLWMGILVETGRGLGSLPVEDNGLLWGAWHGGQGALLAFCVCSLFTSLLVRGVFPVFGILLGLAIWAKGWKPCGQV